MTSPYTPAHLAAGAVKRGVARLAGKYPYHAKVLEKFRLNASPPVGTMGVAASERGVSLLFNPEFVLSLPADQLGAVLLHEVHHVVLGHLTIDAANYPDPWALTVALELSVNEFVREPLPAGAVTLAQFPALPPLESSEQRYHRLRRIQDRRELDALPPAGGAGEGVARVIDNHDVWAEARGDAQAARRAVAELLHQAALEAGGMPADLLDAIRAAGSTPGGGVLVLEGGRQGQLDWKRLLRRYAGQALRLRPVFNRPPRRFPDLVGIVPGKRRVGVQPSVAAIIDTSGSITPHNLEEIDGEVRRLSLSHPVHVIEADCVVHRVYRYHGPLQHVKGRGGTDFRPALARSLLAPLRPALLIYFTDGGGNAPEKAPSWPLIWCLVPGGKAPAPYGRVVGMGPEKPP